MWANTEIISFTEWLKEHNDKLPDHEKVGFYGLDVYSLWESMGAVIDCLEKIGSEDVELAKTAFSCFEPFGRDAQTYGISGAFLGEDCIDEVVKLLMELQAKRKTYEEDPEAPFILEMNALVAVNAERYYRSMVRVGPDSWNIRDHHMVEALTRLVNFHGPNTKAIIWEHNTHIGDARATDMVEEGMVNVGQLLRENHAENQVFAIGFGTHRGTVIAGSRWGGAMEVMKVPPAIPDSWEDLMHQAGSYDQILFFNSDELDFQQHFGHRAIGVVYHPDYELGNYVPSVMSKRYDAFIYVDETEALHPVIVEEVLV